MSEVVTTRPTRPLDSDTLIVMPNHLGADINGPTGDRSSEAEIVAEMTGLRVLTANRPLTGGPYGRLAHDVLRNTDPVARARWIEPWAARIARAVRAEGGGSVALLGYTAACGPLFELACTGQLDVKSLHAVNPMGLSALHFDQNLPPRRLRHLYNSFRYHEGTSPSDLAELKGDSAPLAQNIIRTIGRAPAILHDLKNRTTDITYNEKYWSSGQAFEAAAYVAQVMPHVAMDLSFTGANLEARQTFEKKVTLLQTLRAAQAKGKFAPVTYSFIHNPVRILFTEFLSEAA